MKRLAILAAVVPFALLTACGDSDKDQVSSGLSKADYISKAEVICAKANADVDKIPAPTSPKALETLVSETVRVAEEATSKLKALDPPAADTAELTTKVFDPLDKQVAEGKAFLAQVKSAVAKNDQAALGKLIANPPIGTKADLAWMRSYGFTACVESADTGQ